MSKSFLVSSLDQIPRRLLLEILVAGLTLEVLALTLPIFTQLIFDKVIIHNSLSTLHVAAAGLLIVTMFEGALGFLYNRHIHHFNAKIDMALTAPVMKKILELPLQFFTTTTQGELIKYVRSTTEVRHFLSAATITSFIDVAFIAVVIAIIFAYSAMLAYIVLASIPILIFLTFLIRPSISKNYRELNRLSDNYEALLSEGIHGIGTIKHIGTERYWMSRWIRAHTALVHHGLATRKTATVEDTITKVIQRLVILAVLWIGSVEVLMNRLTYGQLIASYMLTLRVLNPTARFFQLVASFYRLQESSRNLEKLMHAPSELENHPGRRQVETCALDLVNVSFSYPPSSYLTLNKVSIQIPPGACIGVQGASGSGKTTLARILQGHLKPTSGSVRIDGQQLDEFSLDSIRSSIVLLTQDAVLFRGSVRDNLLIGGAELQSRNLSVCLDAAVATDFVSDLPNGLDTLLDERAVTLSSGQRQRLAVARALARVPRVLILDEATNALDLETELLLIERVKRLMQEGTIIIISHRDRVLQRADTCYHLEGGCLREKASV